MKMHKVTEKVLDCFGHSGASSNNLKRIVLSEDEAIINPDADKTVRYGLQSYHEMNYGFLFYIDREEKLNVEVDPATGWVME